MALSYRKDLAYIDEVAVTAIAEQFGTPTYAYSYTSLSNRIKTMQKAFRCPENLLCFAVKANSNLSILKRIFSLGCGADVVSVGELERSLLAGVDPKRVMFSGVGKKDEEIKRAIELGIKSINVESKAEFFRVVELAEQIGAKARIALRVNPNIDAQTHPKISTGMFSSKFGIVEDDVRDLILAVAGQSSIELVGLSCHIGSQITSTNPYGDAAKRMAMLARFAMGQGHQLTFLDMGGGYGIKYLQEELPEFESYYETMNKELAELNLQLVIEPGRSLVGDSGFLITRSMYTKSTPEKNFIVVDAAMNDLLRPSLYDAYHEIVPGEPMTEERQVVEVVGPICETGDILGEGRVLPFGGRDKLFVIKDCGAYGATMASNYNSRPQPAEVLIDGNEVTLVKPRQKLEDIWQAEYRLMKEEE